jgi:2-succinyl-5-enolpyruvyl-6-hydroxy-3-cyclohexene-1-carboxylate synthase
MPTSKALRAWVAELEAPQLVVAPHGWNEPSRRAAAIVRADPALLVEELASRVDRGPDPEWSGAWVEADRAAHEAIEACLADEVEPTEPGLQLALGAAHRDGDLLYTGSSMPIRDQEAFLPGGPADVLHLCNRGANGIDGLVSSGIGAAWASGRPTTVITGELGMLHDLGALAALEGLETPVRIVVIDNGGGRIFDFLPQAELLPAKEMEALFLTPRSLDLAAAARAFGVAHRRLARLDELAAAIAAGTGVIEVQVEGSRNTEVHTRLLEAARSRLTSLPGMRLA